jgi:hypothetical protein
MQVLEGFKEASPFFSDTSYQSWMGHINPLVQTYEPAEGIFPLWKSTAEMPTTRYGGGPDDAYTYEEPAGVNYSQWEDIAKQLGYTGPVYGTVGYDIEGGGITGIDPQFKSFVDQKRAEGYDFVQYQPDLRNYRQKYGFQLPSGEIVGEFYGEGRDADVVSLFKDFILPVGTAILGIPGYGASIPQSIGSAILPAELAAGLGSALNLSPEVLAASSMRASRVLLGETHQMFFGRVLCLSPRRSFRRASVRRWALSLRRTLIRCSGRRRNRSPTRCRKPSPQAR